MLFFVAIGTLTRPAPHFKAANGQGITLCLFDDKTGTLEQTAAPLRVENPLWLVAAPEQRRLYAVTDSGKSHQSALAAFDLDLNTKSIRPLATQPAGGLEGCHASLSPDGKWVFMANYRGAALAVFPVTPDGLAPAQIFFHHHGSGPDRLRQDAPHAHCVQASPDGRFLFVADLGIDRLVAYDLSQIPPAPTPRHDVHLPPGSGPRHFTFSADGRFVYLVCELTPSVITLSYDPDSGRLEQRGSVSLVPLNGTAAAPAGIVQHPTKKRLFLSVRQTDQIISLKTESRTGLPSITSCHTSGGQTPRDLVLSPSGRHLLVAHQDSDLITVWALTRNGQPEGPRTQMAIGTPMAITFVPVSLSPGL